MLPPFAIATVISQDPDNYALNVSLQGFFGGQMPAVSVQVLTHGPRDAVRGHFPELPLPGQLGLVAFPRGDSRNGIWLGSLSPSLVDASSAAPGNGNTSFASHFGGGVTSRGRDGTLFEEFPDGTTVMIGTAAPSFTRHTVGEGQQRARTPFTAAERVAATPSPFMAVLTHPSGATASLSTAGAWTLTAAPGQSVAVSGAVVNVTATSSASVTAPAITMGDGGTLQALLNTAAATLFNSHTHADPQGGVTGPPSQTMGAAQETAILTAQ